MCASCNEHSTTMRKQVSEAACASEALGQMREDVMHAQLRFRRRSAVQIPQPQVRVWPKYGLTNFNIILNEIPCREDIVCRYVFFIFLFSNQLSCAKTKPIVPKHRPQTGGRPTLPKARRRKNHPHGCGRENIIRL